MVPDEPNHTRLRAVGQSLTAYRKVRYLLRPRHAQVCWKLLRPSGRHRLARLHHLQGGVVIHCYRTSHSFGVDGGSLYTEEPRAARSTDCITGPASQEHRMLHWSSLPIIRSKGRPGATNASLKPPSQAHRMHTRAHYRYLTHYRAARSTECNTEAVEPGALTANTEAHHR